MCFYVSAGVEFAEFGHLSGCCRPLLSNGEDLTWLPLPTGCYLNLWLVSRPIPNKSHRIKILLKYLRERFNKDRANWFGA